MTRMQQKEEITIIGIELRTNDIDAPETIPAFWKKFRDEKMIELLTDLESVDIYSVYGHYDNAGYSSDDEYSFILGVTTDDFSKEIQEHFATVLLPTQDYMVFPVPQNSEANVPATWKAILNNKIIERTFDADYECYKANGYIDILIGIR
jgi:predicted transcriptional regulator YdeE